MFSSGVEKEASFFFFLVSLYSKSTSSFRGKMMDVLNLLLKNCMNR